MAEAADTNEKEIAGTRKKLTPKRIKSRLERTESSNDNRVSRKARNKTAQALLKQIASGQIKNPQAAAKAYFDALETRESEANSDSPEE
ncbi:MAG: hypothetical protein AAFQ54_06570 [Pseudomonadota bacterium]